MEVRLTVYHAREGQRVVWVPVGLGAHVERFYADLFGNDPEIAVRQKGQRFGIVRAVGISQRERAQDFGFLRKFFLLRYKRELHVLTLAFVVADIADHEASRAGAAFRERERFGVARFEVGDFHLLKILTAGAAVVKKSFVSRVINPIQPAGKSF